jgi:hypothetical protein
MSGYFSPRWQQDELQHLDRHLHSCSFPQLVEKMQAWQQQHKQPIRSTDAIRQKAYKLGRKSEYQEDNLSIVQLAQMLDIARHRVKLWRDRGLPVSQKHKNREVSIAILDFQIWAKSNLDYLYGIDRDRLSYFLSDKEIDNIPQKSPFRRRVKCLDNHQVFPNIAEAARSIGVHKVTLGRAIDSGQYCGGYCWQKIE